MTGFAKIAKLDFYTMKSQFAGYLSLVFAVLLFGFMGSSVTWLCITGAWFVALMSSGIFAIQEKNNLDRLYGSVCVELRDIVLGRYVFVFSCYLVTSLAIIILYSGFALITDIELDLHDAALGFCLSFLIFSAITGMQLPLFFKLGYTKGCIWATIPFVAVMALTVVPSFVSALSGVVEFMQSNQTVLMIGCILAGCSIQFLSYRTAVVAYRKRKRG